MADISRCAANNTVVGTTAANFELQVMLPLARSAFEVGFPCIVVMPFEAISIAELNHADSALLFVLPVPDPPLLPRQRWYNYSSHHDYIHRRRQLYRIRLWRMLAATGHDVLGLDPNRRLLKSPIPALGAFRTRNDAQYGAGAPPDIVGGTPGWYLKQYNLHTMYIRSTLHTRRMLAQAEARTFGCWDELVFSEELSWGDGSTPQTLPCCHSACLSTHFTAQPIVPAAGVPSQQQRSCAADDAMLPLAAGPPAAGRHNWPKKGSKAWKPSAYNTLSIPLHRFGRCTGRDVSCVGLHPACPPPPPPFTREVSLAGKRKEREDAKKRGERHRAERAAKLKPTAHQGGE